MNTDLERFKKLYAEFGIKCKEYLSDDFYIINLGFNEGEDIKKSTISEKFWGWPGFYSRVTFDKNGKFISQGFWE